MFCCSFFLNSEKHFLKLKVKSLSLFSLDTSDESMPCVISGEASKFPSVILQIS